MIEIFVPGRPIPQPRHKVSTRGKFARAYIPKDHAVHAWKMRIALYAKRVCKTPLEGPLVACISFRFKRPAGMKGVYNPKRPDRDNLEKAVLDATQGILFHDDSQICDGPVGKFYVKTKEEEGVKITLATIEEYTGSIDTPVNFLVYGRSA